MKAKGIYRRSLAQQVVCGDLGRAPQSLGLKREIRKSFWKREQRVQSPWIKKEWREGGAYDRAKGWGGARHTAPAQRPQSRV